MVQVGARLCVDRFEAQLVEEGTGATLSPYYPPEKKLAVSLANLWEKERHEVGDDQAKATPLPPLPAFQRQRAFEPRATSRKNVVPSGYVSGKLAALACKNAGKRLCREEEWRYACRGEARRDYPYGERYEQGRCNVFREGHPAGILHGDMTTGHTDPRLNRVAVNGRPLLRKTGETEVCGSVWGDDAIWDMVGNLDEWVDDPEGTFLGGFYARSKRDGCRSTVRAHTFDYFDYSTGVRCCTELPGSGPTVPHDANEPLDPSALDVTGRVARRLLRLALHPLGPSRSAHREPLHEPPR